MYWMSLVDKHHSLVPDSSWYLEDLVYMELSTFVHRNCAIIHFKSDDPINFTYQPSKELQ